MKGGLVVAVTVLLAAGAAPVASQWPELTGFNIAVTRTAKGVSLACAAGCSWQRLEFGLTVSGKPTPVNEHGMADDKTANAEKAGNFLIRFGMNDDGFALSCDRGCAWRTLGWTFPANGTATRINEYGMVPNRK